MRAYYQGNTYLVEYTDSDAHCFVAHTDGSPGVVAGKGAFVFDTRTGDMIGARGSAAKHGGEIEWLAFSQDAQDYGRGQLMREGVAVNPFNFGAYMPELAANPKKGKSPKGRRIELIHTPDQWTTLKPGAKGYVVFVDDAGTIFVDWDDGQRLGLVPGTDHFQYVAQANPSVAEHKRAAEKLVKDGKHFLKEAHKFKRDYDDHGNLEAHNYACQAGRSAYANTWMAEAEALTSHIPGTLDSEILTLRDNAVKLLNELVCPWSDIMWNWSTVPPTPATGNPSPVSRISRTRGVKTMRGPYDARRGYEPWITRRGKLGAGFLTTMSAADRHKSLDRCVAEYGYRSCLGSIMALERAKRGPRGTGEGVGVKYAKKLTESRSYLKKKFGGVGSFGPQKQERRLSVAADAASTYRAANPSELQEISRGEISGKLDLDPDQERLLDRLVLNARNDGDAYRAGKNARGAVELAFRNIQEADKQYLIENYQMGVRDEAIRLVKRRWRTSNPMPNPCFGLHVHGAEVGPVLQQLQGNPSEEHHQEAARALAKDIEKQLDQSLAKLGKVEDAYDKRQRKSVNATVTLSAAEVAVMRRESEKLMRLGQMLGRFRAETLHAGSGFADELITFDDDEIFGLVADLQKSIAACGECYPPRMIDAAQDVVRAPAAAERRAREAREAARAARRMATRKLHLGRMRAKLKLRTAELAKLERKRKPTVDDRRRKVMMANRVAHLEARIARVESWGDGPVPMPGSKKKTSSKKTSKAWQGAVRAAKKKAVKKKPAKKKAAKKKAAKKKTAKKKVSR